MLSCLCVKISTVFKNSPIIAPTWTLNRVLSPVKSVKDVTVRAVDKNRKEYITFFRESSPYIHVHRGRTFVIMLGGDALAHHNLSNIINDIALLSSLGVRLVLVHGARPQIDERLKERGLCSQWHNGRRVTDKATLEHVKDAVGNMRAMIESKLSLGLVNSPMHGARIRVLSGNFVTAKPLGVHDGLDYQHTGEIRKIDKTAIQQLLDSGYVVLLPCLGLSPSGEIFNLDVEEVATFTAIKLNAEKLILFGEEQGIFEQDGALISRISPSKAEARINNVNKEGRQLFKAAIMACRGGVERSQIISFAQDGALLLELFTRDGTGTMISRDHYEEIRSASNEDISGILELIRPLERQGVLRRRSRKELEREIKLFSVIVLDGMIIGCASLHPFSDNESAELACVVVHPDYRSAQRGDRLLEHAEQQARELGMRYIFVLTTQTAHWFIERGFLAVSEQVLPKDKKTAYNVKRQSKVFLKELS